MKKNKSVKKWEGQCGILVAEYLIKDVRRGNYYLHAGEHMEIGDKVRKRIFDTNLVTPYMTLTSKVRAGLTTANFEFTIDCHPNDFNFEEEYSDKENI